MLYARLGVLVEQIGPIPESLSFLSAPEYRNLRIFFYDKESGAWNYCWETEFLPNLNPIDRIKLERLDKFQVWDTWVRDVVHKFGVLHNLGLYDRI